MIITLTFVGGGVHLRTRFVASKERLEEQQKRTFLYRGQMGTHPHSALRDTASFLGHLATFRWPKLHYRNPSNTNVFYWGGKVCSLCVLEALSMHNVVLGSMNYISGATPSSVGYQHNTLTECVKGHACMAVGIFALVSSLLTASLH